MNQQEVNHAFQDAVINKDLPLVKYYLLESNPKADIFYNNNDALMYAAGTNQVELMDFLLTSPELPIHSDDEKASHCLFSGKTNCSKDHLELYCLPMALSAKEKALVIACTYGCFPAVRYLLTCEKFSTPIDIHYNNEEALVTACRGSQIYIVQYLLTHKKLRERANIQAANNRALRWSFRSSLPNKDMVEYLLTSPKLKEHANIYDNDCEPFFELVNSTYNKESVCEYLVFDYRIKILPPIEKFIARVPEHFISKMLARRELYSGLQRSLVSKDLKDNHSKI